MADQDERDPWEKPSGGTAAAVAERDPWEKDEETPPTKTPESEGKPGFLRRMSKVVLGTEHPLDELGREVGNAIVHPINFAGDVSETAGIPREIWSDPSWENIRRIGGTGIPGMVFGEQGLIKHPIDTMERVTGANEASESARQGDIPGMAGAMAGGVLNLGLATGKLNPLNARAKAAEVATKVKNKLYVPDPNKQQPVTDFRGGAHDESAAARAARQEQFPDVEEGAAGKISEGPTALEHGEVRRQIKELRKPIPVEKEPTVVPITEGPTAGEHAAVRAGQARINKLGERKVVPLRESPTPKPEETELEPTTMEGGIPIIGKPKVGPNATEARTTGSEGTAARWTNESLPAAALKGNRTAIEQLGRRNIPLPENVRYVMGDIDLPRIVYNPKEVTRFEPESTPIRDMSRPETSSRQRIQPAGEGAIPPVEPLFKTPSFQVPSETPPPVAAAPRGEAVLPGMENAVAQQAEGAAKVKGEDLTRQANTPKNVDEAAGQLETKGPLFRGTEASPQKEIFAPGGQEPSPAAGEPATAEELRPEHVDLPKLKETFTQAAASQKEISERYFRGQSTLKELQDAQKATEKAKDAVDEAEGTNEQMRQMEERLAKEAERNSPERIDAARNLVFDTIQKLKGMERGGPSFSEYTEEDRPIVRDWRGGERYGGKVGSIPSGRATIPWLKNRPKWGWSKLEAAMMSGKSKLYNDVLRAADDFLQGQTPEGRAEMERKVAAQYIPAAPPAKFVNFQKPTRLGPPPEQPTATTPAEASAVPPSNLPKTVRFSKSQWNRFTPDRQKAEQALAKRRGQTIDIYTKR